MENSPTIKQLEEEFEAIEKECDNSELEWQFKQALKEYKGEDQIISFQDWKKNNKDVNKKGFSSGLVELDDITNGFHKGDLITITGETGQGKTSFAQFLTMGFSESKIKSLWFSYEMPVNNFLMKFDELPDGYLPKVLTERNITWIERKIVEGIVKFGIECVFIDHLHYLFDLSSKVNASLVIGDIMRNLKIIANKYNITIFILAHTGKSREDGSVGLDNIRDSSFVAQESDYVIAVWRVKTIKSKDLIRADGIEYTPFSKIFVAKNRYTGTVASINTRYVKGKYIYEREDGKIPTQREQQKDMANDEINVNQLFK